ncbi:MULTISPECIES: TerD family protein [Pseudomonas]|jgi:tellurium resistance protein TerD|uniref:Chemical-damaging agent resistance protein C n=8 Tax=Pseudomonas TaxID=286 RepID=A0A1V0M5L7_PSEAI|nr:MULTISPECIES: TerD family protein [Pseudomonas]AVX92635.1 TerD family protein [Pseudomonas koreensis]EQL43694.1 tellurium resistance protein TerE [Pseudomonas aeruginosa VRFPA03]EVT82344.1 tellurium resistance protein TerE [Pseudomonas aeruginosa VRFPA09]MCP8473301.1 TerD family protein [Pseudomonas triclosanedens]MCP8479286.1 TerD family protein [Pseudomonas triclosanedens]MDU7559626.1 TerD family protein [Pseudomonas sp.]WQN30019.1 TerD family protein [Stutzerimonas stutzeri]
MAVSLSKGGNVSLSKEAPGLSEVVVGLGWDPRVTDGTEFDLDASIFITGENGKVLNDSSFIFYNNKKSTDGSVEHLGDNRSGQGDGDDEQVNVKLTGLGADVKKLVFAVTIHDAEARKQSFGQVGNAYIRVLNKADGKEIARYDLSEDASTETAMIFGELYRHNDEFKFKAIGQGFAGGLKPLAEAHGVSIG